jgi:hypothetical protein
MHPFEEPTADSIADKEENYVEAHLKRGFHIYLLASRRLCLSARPYSDLSTHHATSGLP